MRAGLCFLCLLAVDIAGASTTPRDFKWRQQVKGTIEKRGLYRIKVGGEIFDGCRRFPSDLRLYHSESAECPYWIWKPAPTVEESVVPADKINDGWIPEESCRRIDMIVKTDEGRGPAPRHNAAEINTGGRRFLRRVEVFGRNAGQNWAILGKGWLYADIGQGPRRNNRIEYSRSDFEELRLHIYADVKDATETVMVDSVQLLRRHKAKGEYERVPLAPMESENAGGGARVQSMFFDIGFHNRPLSRISIAADTPAFVRVVRVYGRNAQTEDWVGMGSGTIERVGDAIRDTIDINARKIRYLRVDILNHDDPPLKNPAVTAFAVSRFIVFEPLLSDPVTVYYGDEYVNPPRYDLRRRTQDQVNKATPVSLGERKKNQSYRPKGYGAAGRWLAGIAVAIVSALVLWSVVSMMRRQTDI